MRPSRIAFGIWQSRADAHRTGSCKAITQDVEREEKRESFNQAALQAWKVYQTTGLHVTHEEMDAYLAKLEAGEDVEPLACHG